VNELSIVSSGLHWRFGFYNRPEGASVVFGQPRDLHTCTKLAILRVKCYWATPRVRQKTRRKIEENLRQDEAIITIN